MSINKRNFERRKRRECAYCFSSRPSKADPNMRRKEKGRREEKRERGKESRRKSPFLILAIFNSRGGKEGKRKKEERA